MRYFVPRLDVPPSPDADSALYSEKLGGRPAGLPPGLWPSCRDCGGLMSLIAQFDHDDARLPLGGEGRRLFVFMCDQDPGMCATWEAESGANACLVLEAAQMVNGGPPAQPEPPSWNEAIITGWIEFDDAIDQQLKARFFSDANYYGSAEEGGLCDAIVEKVPMATKLGSVPRWLQSAEEGPRDQDFLGQIDCQIRFDTEPRRIEPWMSKGDGSADSPLYWADGPSFGDGGIAYLFADRRVDPPRVTMFWQCL